MDTYEMIVKHLNNKDVSRAGLAAMHTIKHRDNLVLLIKELCRSGTDEGINTYIKGGIWKWGCHYTRTPQLFRYYVSHYKVIFHRITGNELIILQKRLARVLTAVYSELGGYEYGREVPPTACDLHLIVCPELFDALIDFYGLERLILEIVAYDERDTRVATVRNTYRQDFCCLVIASGHEQEIRELIQSKVSNPEAWLNPPTTFKEYYGYYD